MSEASWPVFRYTAEGHVRTRLLFLRERDLLDVNPSTGAVTSRKFISDITKISVDSGTPTLFRIVYRKNEVRIYLSDERNNIVNSLLVELQLIPPFEETDLSKLHEELCFFEFQVQGIGEKGKLYSHVLYLGAQFIRHVDRATGKVFSSHRYSDVEGVAEDASDSSQVTIQYPNDSDYQFIVTARDKPSLLCVLRGRVHYRRTVLQREMEIDLPTGDFEEEYGGSASTPYAGVGTRPLPSQPAYSAVAGGGGYSPLFQPNSPRSMAGPGPPYMLLNGSGDPSFEMETGLGRGTSILNRSRRGLGMDGDSMEHSSIVSNMEGTKVQESKNEKIPDEELACEKFVRKGCALYKGIRRRWGRRAHERYFRATVQGELHWGKSKYTIQKSVKVIGLIPDLSEKEKLMGPLPYREWGFAVIADVSSESMALFARSPDEYESWIRGLRLILMRIYGQPLATTGAVRPKGDKMVPVKQSRSGSPRSSKHEAEDDGSVEGGEDGEASSVSSRGNLKPLQSFASPSSRSATLTREKSTRQVRPSA